MTLSTTSPITRLTSLTDNTHWRGCYRVSKKIKIESFEVRQLWALSGHFGHFDKKNPKMSKSVQRVQKCPKWPEGSPELQNLKKLYLKLFGALCKDTRVSKMIAIIPAMAEIIPMEATTTTTTLGSRNTWHTSTKLRVVGQIQRKKTKN